MSEAMKTRIDGTYPYDDFAWQKVRNIPLEEAAKIVGIKEEDFHKYSKSFGDTYLWLNKGFIKIKGTDTAVYLHDGKYSLIKKAEETVT